jgi:thiol-disulfide isomerase/thioredoxin
MGSKRLFAPKFAERKTASAVWKATLILLLVGCVAAADTPYKAPNFASDAEWIDTGAAGSKVPHSIKGYRGHVLVIDFWEYTCINCIRDFGVLKRWYSKYHSFGFDIVGVHYGEFPMGFKVQNVREAAERFRLPWPVVADVNGSMWKAYNSHMWPNRYLIDPKGDIVMQLKGEGNNRAMEEKIQELLAVDHPDVGHIPLDPPEDTFAPQCGVPTQETYVGIWFGRSGLQHSKPLHDGDIVNFGTPQQPGDGEVALLGKWLTQQDGVVSESKEDEATLRYHARSVYAVLSVDNPKKPVRLNLLQDGKPLGKDEAGVDVRFDSMGSYIDVSESRMYYLLKNPQFGSHLLILKPQGEDFALHSFTYGNDCQQNFSEM